MDGTDLTLSSFMVEGAFQETLEVIGCHYRDLSKNIEDVMDS